MGGMGGARSPRNLGVIFEGRPGSPGAPRATHGGYGGRPQPPIQSTQNRSMAKLTTDRAIWTAASWSAPSDAVIVSTTVPGTAKSARSA